MDRRRRRKIAEEFFDAVCEWSCEVRGEILVYHDGYFEKDKQLFDSIKNALFDNLVLPESLKQQIQNDFQQFFESRELYERYKIPWARASSLVHPETARPTPQGTDKSARQAIASTRSFKRNGNGQENMAEVFKRARMKTPCLVVLEDLDSMIDDKNRAFFLNELDGFQSNMGCCARYHQPPEKLDSSILDRPAVSIGSTISVAGCSGAAGVYCEMERRATAGVACNENGAGSG